MVPDELITPESKDQDIRQIHERQQLTQFWSDLHRSQSRVTRLPVNLCVSAVDVQVNVNWNKCKSDGRSLWKAIDWKGKSVKEKTEDISADTIHRYFKEIFQSPKTRDNPTLDMAETYENNVHVDELDGDMTIEELNGAMKEIGTGTSLDGLAPDILKVIPMSLRMLILQLFNMVFTSTYPTIWRDQLLLPHSKKGHCPAEPKLRGIGIGALLSRIYDKILNKRFLTWYIPNVIESVP